MRVFFDTGAWLALEVANDINHEAAKNYLRTLKDKRALFYTNDYVLAETYTRLIYDLHLKAAQYFREKILEGTNKNLALLEVGPKDRDRAWEELEKYADHKLSFTDGTVIANFRVYNLDYIFTFDRHFRDIHLPTNLQSIS